jgi:hypothetical protein
MTANATERLDWLKRQIAQGWKIDVPVIERMVAYGFAGQENALEFILRHEKGCQVIAVPDGPEVRVFLQENAFTTVEM